MGQSRSKENDALSKSTHFSTKEIRDLRQNVKEQDQNNITEVVFKDSVKQCVPTVSIDDDVFLKRLYAAFGGDQEKSIDFRKLVDGLSIFMKGTSEEKLKLSFRLYDVDKDGFISKEEIEQVMLQLSQMLSEEEERFEEIQRSINCLFEDLDIDGDGKLSFEEYKLSAMKEPLVADFIERFLDKHNLSDKPKVVSRPTSVGSRKSNSQRRLSFRLSQAELLDYSHQQQIINNNLTTPTDTTPNTSPIDSLYLPLTPPQPIMTPTLVSSPNGKPSLPHRSSRGASMASLDATMVSM